MMMTTPVRAAWMSPHSAIRRGGLSRSLMAVVASCTLSLLGPGRIALAQENITYRNTQGGRPVRTEDAYAVDRYSLDLYLAPVSVERSGSGDYNWAGTPGII